MIPREVHEEVAETYDFIERLLSPHNNLQEKNKVISDAILNSLIDLHEAGIKQGGKKETQIETP